MSFKEEFQKEKEDLLHNKRPYETAAVVIFGILMFQQIAFLLYRTVEYLIDLFTPNTTPFFSCSGMTTPAFFARIIGVDASSVVIVILAWASLALWYAMIYFLVFRYCQRHGMAKWTWTTLILFGPNLIFVPPYIVFIIYVFRPYFFRFVKTVVAEYKAFDPKKKFKEEEPGQDEASV
jgi:hypothetical protein